MGVASSRDGRPVCSSRASRSARSATPIILEAHLIVDQADIDLIRLGRRAWVKIYGRAETTYLSEVSEIAKRSRDEIPPELSNMPAARSPPRPIPRQAWPSRRRLSTR